MSHTLITLSQAYYSNQMNIFSSFFFFYLSDTNIRNNYRKRHVTTLNSIISMRKHVLCNQVRHFLLFSLSFRAYFPLHSSLAHQNKVSKRTNYNCVYMLLSMDLWSVAIVIWLSWKKKKKLIIMLINYVSFAVATVNSAHNNTFNYSIFHCVRTNDDFAIGV